MKKKQLLKRIMLGWMLSIVVLALVGNLVPQVKATASWVTIWEDQFTDKSSLYVIPNDSDFSIQDGTYLLINSSGTYTPRGIIRGLHPVPVFNLTIKFTGYAPTGIAIFRFGIRSKITDSANALQLPLGDPTDMGAFFELWSWGTNLGKFRVYKWADGVGNPIYNEYSYTNQSDNTLEMKWDGINYKVAYTLDGSCKGEYDFYNRPNLTGTINPMMSSGEFEFWKHSSGDAGNGFKINSITQRIYVNEDKVYAVAGKFLGFGFDAQEINVWNDLVSVLDDHNASASLFIRPTNVGAPDYMSWSQMTSLIADKNWESDLHTGMTYKDKDPSTANLDLTNKYTWVKNNLTNLGLTNSEASPKMFTALQGSHNWTQAQYGWQNHALAVRTSLIPYVKYANNLTGSIFGLSNTNKLYYDWAVSSTEEGGNHRAFFAFTHGTGDISEANFDSFLDDLYANNYVVLPFWRGYKSLLHSNNSTFTVSESTASTLVFSASTNGYDVFVRANKPSGSGTWYVYDDLNQRISVKEDLSDKIGFWVKDGRTYTLRSTKLEGSIDSFTPHYASISASSRTATSLTFTISAPTGNTSTTTIYCGSLGQPIGVSGASSSYNALKTILTLMVVHSSDQEVEVIWASAGTPALRNLIRNNYYLVFTLLGLMPIAFGAITIVGLIKGKDQLDPKLLASLISMVAFLIIAFIVVWNIMNALIGG